MWISHEMPMKIPWEIHVKLVSTGFHTHVEILQKCDVGTL